jgi:uncharacterized protein (DUF58 family)
VRAAGVRFTPSGAGALVASFGALLLAFYTANLVVVLVAVFLSAFVLAELLAFAVATRGFSPEAFAASRVECTTFARVRGAALLTVRIASSLPGSFYAELYDPHPEKFEIVAGDAHLTTWWETGETVTLAYVASPQLRGLFDVGPTVIVAHDSLGLAFRAVALPTRWRVEAIPQPPSVRLGYPARLPNLVVGQTSLRSPGGGTDFHGLREYQPSDEPRNISWTRSGKGTLYVRQYERESQQDLLVLLDVGPGMAVGLPYADALETAVDAAAHVMRRSFDEDTRVGIVVFDDRVLRYVPARRGSDHEFRVFRALTAAQIEPRPASLAEALEYLLPRLGRATNLLAFSTVVGEPSRLASACANLQRRGHRLFVLAPDLGAMLPAATDATVQRSLELGYGPELAAGRARALGVQGAGAAVGFYGRDGALDVVNALYGQRRMTSGAG